MGGHALNGQAQAGGLAAKALGADAQGVDLGQKLPLQFGIIGVGVGRIQRPQQRLFGKVGHLVEAAAYANAQNHRRAGVWPGGAHRIHNEFFKALYPIGGLEHGQAAHILAAKALGGNGNAAGLSGGQMHGNGGGGVIPGVAPAQRVGHHAFAQIPLGIAPAHALIDGLLKISLDMHIRTQLHKHAGHTRILADGQAALASQGKILLEQAQGVLGQGPGLPAAGFGQSLGHIPGQLPVGPDAQPGHGIGNLLGGYGFHRSSLPCFCQYTTKIRRLQLGANCFIIE